MESYEGACRQSSKILERSRTWGTERTEVGEKPSVKSSWPRGRAIPYNRENGSLLLRANLLRSFQEKGRAKNAPDTTDEKIQTIPHSNRGKISPKDLGKERSKAQSGAFIKDTKNLPRKSMKLHPPSALKTMGLCGESRQSHYGTAEKKGGPKARSVTEICGSPQWRRIVGEARVQIAG